jgi:RND family efflux transporter MFP subunit
LINPGSGSGVELFKVADLHQMRIYVRVPQADIDQLRPGMIAKLRLPQYPHETFIAKLSTTANAVAKESRTVLVELIADNKDGRLWPGTFAEAHFELPPEADIYHLPTSALLFREHGLEVATIGPDNKVVLKPIAIGRDLGTEVEVSAGLTPADRVIDSPSDSLGDGDQVRLAEATGGTTENTAEVAPGKPATGAIE